MDYGLSALYTAGTTLVAGVVWAVRQEGRITGHDKLFEEREKLALERHQTIKDALMRIETKIEAANNISLNNAGRP